MPAPEFWIAVGLILLLAGHLVISMRERARMAEDMRRERSELLNRLISKDAREFAMVTRATVPAPVDTRQASDYVTIEEPGREVEKDDGLGMPVT